MTVIRIGSGAERFVGLVLLMVVAGCGGDSTPKAAPTGTTSAITQQAVTGDKADENNPDKLVHLDMVHLGMMLLDRGETAEAIRVLSQAVDADPQNVSAHTGLGTALQYSGRFDEAAAQFRKAIQIDPNNGDVHNNLGITLASQGNPEEAIKHFQRALELRPDDVRAHKNLGGALQALNRYEEAVQHYNKALRIKADDQQIHWNLGNALKALGRPEEAVAHYRDAVRINPGFRAAHLRLVSVLVELGRMDEANNHLANAKFNDVGVQLALASALRKSARNREAIPYYEKALELDPNNAQAHIDLATTLERVARFEEAVAHWDKALELVPDNMLIKNNLAWLLATCPADDVRDGQRALELAEQAARMAEYKNALALGTLAAAHAESGNYQEATTWQEKAIQYTTDEQKPDFQLRLELYKAGKPYRQTSEPNQEAP